MICARNMHLNMEKEMKSPYESCLKNNNNKKNKQPPLNSKVEIAEVYQEKVN